MNEIFLLPTEYSKKFLEPIVGDGRLRPLFSSHLESLLYNIYLGNYDTTAFIDESIIIVKDELRTPVFSNFKRNFQQSIESSKRNNISGFESFTRVDICLGCAQYLDALHLTYTADELQILSGEYRYNNILTPAIAVTTVGKLIPNTQLIISVPSVAMAKLHPQWADILIECEEKNISIHIDGAWIPAAKNINIDLAHPCIKSFSSSMSKGYGTSGWNRIGLRWSKLDIEDCITVMNDHAQIHMYAVALGNYILENTEIDHLWNTYENIYYRICKDFNLTPTDVIHIGYSEPNRQAGLSQLIRYAEKHLKY